MPRGSFTKALAAVLVVLGMAGQIFMASKLHGLKVDQRKKRVYTVSLPGKLVKLISLDFGGLVSDVQFLELAVFFGDPNKRIDHKFIDRTLELVENITLLDPRFQDPYYLAQAVVWESDAARLRRINRLLEKAVRHRTWDGWMPFMLGFNHFYFMKDYQGAARYLKISSERPGLPRLAAGLAARMYQRTGRTLTALVFLQEMIKRLDDPEAAKNLKLRLDAFKALYVLERAVNTFLNGEGRYPRRLEELVEARVLDAIPEDPYGGRFFISKEGKVASTSGFFTSFKARQKEGRRRGPGGR
jgi:hypothetical protein